MNVNTPYRAPAGTTEKSISFVLLGEESAQASRPAAALVSMTSETGRTAYQIRVLDADNMTVEAVAYTSWTLALARWANLLVENGTAPADAFSALIALMGDKPRRVLIDGAGRFIVI